MEDNISIATVYKELKDFRAENNKRWEENDKRWEQTERRWKENEKRWEENERRWKENKRRWEENDRKWWQNEKRFVNVEKRLTALEEGRIKDKKEILEILDTMQKNITDQFADLKDYMDAKFDKIFAAQTVNDIEHAEYRQLLKAYGIRINFQNSRITYLEDWKKECEDGFVPTN